VESVLVEKGLLPLDAVDNWLENFAEKQRQTPAKPHAGRGRFGYPCGIVTITRDPRDAVMAQGLREFLDNVRRVEFRPYLADRTITAGGFSADYNVTR